MSMKYLTVLILLLTFSPMCIAQNPCGTPTEKDPWLVKYQKDRENYAHRGGELYLPITINNVAEDDGSKIFSETNLLKSLCGLQTDFQGTGITFFMKNYLQINDTDLFSHSDFKSGGDLMRSYNTPNSLNCYIVDDPVGNCGYFFRNAGVALNTGCIAVGDHTWAHEMGHNLSLPHPFFGWEGGVGYDDEISHSYNNPAPDSVLRQRTLWFNGDSWTDTLIQFAVATERLDGSNCYDAADGFCDTKPDYLSYRWSCNLAESISNVQQTDPDGGKFYSDASLFMSYSLDVCASRFSEEQIEAMKANAIDEQADMVLFSNPTNVINDDDVLTMNLDDPFDAGLDFKDIDFSWQAVQNADFYLVTLGVEPTMSFILKDTIVTQPNVSFKEISTNHSDYYWKVTPFNSIDFCDLQSSPITQINFTEVSAADDINLNAISIYPNLLREESTININGISHVKSVSYELINPSGELIQKGIISNDEIALENNLANGIYFVRIKIEGKNQLFKIMKM